MQGYGGYLFNAVKVCDYFSASVVQGLKGYKMTRRNQRYLRRKAKRQARRTSYIAKFDDFNTIFTRNNLFNSADLAKKNVMWKGTVQRWSINQLLNTEQLYRDLQANKDVRKGFSKFTINERGKIRHISAVKIYERVVQKCLCKYALYPVLTKPLIFDNSASQKNKGVKFAQDRLVKFLRRYYRKNGNEGYILLVDFRKYFDSINHDIAKANIRRYFTDKKLLKYVDDFIDAYGCVGLGLGSETSQIHAISYPNNIDHTITEKGFKIHVGRYMDDSYVIAKEKPTLIKVLNIIKKVAETLKLTLSPRKTVITKLKNGFVWLKTKFYLLSSGKILRKPCRKAVVRQRRKLKKHIVFLRNGLMSLKQVTQALESWAGSMKRRNARLSVWKMRQILWSNLK